MREIQSCLGLPLIALDTAEQVGLLAQFLTDPVLNRVRALVLTDGTGHGGKTACLFEDVMRFGPDAILLHSAASVRALCDVPELRPFLDPAWDPFFRKAWTSDGQCLGRFTPHTFEEATAHVSAFRLEPRDGGEPLVVCRTAVVSSGRSLTLFDRMALPLPYPLSARESFEIHAPAAPVVPAMTYEAPEEKIDISALVAERIDTPTLAAEVPYAPAPAVEPVDLLPDPAVTLFNAYDAPPVYEEVPAAPTYEEAPLLEEIVPAYAEALPAFEEEAPVYVETPAYVEAAPIFEQAPLQPVEIPQVFVPAPLVAEVPPEPEDSFAALVEVHTGSEWGAALAPSGISLTFEELLTPVPYEGPLPALPEEENLAPAEGWNGITAPASSPEPVSASASAPEAGFAAEEDLTPAYTPICLEPEVPVVSNPEAQKVRDLFNGSKDELLPLVIGKVADRVITDLDGEPIVSAGQPISRKVAETAWRNSKLYELFIAAQPTNASYTV